ncbi:hypothetical protein BGZ97_005819 [Linnemannia gamsii]|jgi:hypothetical protein|uniref:Uncharacterized protein n=1 Tax=Linnemannia gamsii TaxID=64522 RepID=A0A9P6US35_9FUNG|nr:hypothetical protein BGZ97_005819 [Linnemannia gamsii]
MTPKPLSLSLTLFGLGLVLDLAAAAATTATNVGTGTTTPTALSTANLNHSGPTPIAKALMMAVGSSLFSQIPPRRTTEEPSGQDEEEEGKAFGPGTRRIRKVSGWPSSLKIEIDDLEVGGLTMPLIQTFLRNSKVGSKNFGNIDLVSPDSGIGNLGSSSQGNAGQVVHYV